MSDERSRRPSESSRVEAFYLRGHPTLLDTETDLQFFRRTEPLLTVIGYGISALVGWFVSPALALLIFLVFPLIYVVRVRSANG